MKTNKKRLLSMLLAVVMVICVFVPLSASETKFTDVPSSHWAHAQITDAVKSGIVL